MKKPLIASLILILVASSLFAQQKQDDIDAIKKVIQTAYVEGLQNEGDAAKIDKGFHPNFDLLIPSQDLLRKYPIKDWKKDVLKRKKDGKLPASDDKKVSVTFDFVDVEGTAAVAKIKFFVGKEQIYVDYISLYRFGSEWKLVSKIYYKLPKLME